MFGVELAVFSDLKITFFFWTTLHTGTNTVLLLPANHLWPVESEEVGCVHVVEEIKTKQTPNPPPPPAKTPSSDPWQYNLGRCCRFTWVRALVYGCLLWASCLLRLYSTVLPHILFHAFFLGVACFPRDTDVLLDHARVVGSFCINDGIIVPIAV